MSQFIEMFGDPYTGWKYPTERLGEVYNIGTGGTPDRKVYGYYEGQIPWVKSTEVSYCELYDTEEHISEQAIKDSNCSLYPSGTILLAMYGQGTTRGRVAQLRTDAAVNQAIAAIQVQDETESLFLYSMLKVCYDYVRNLAVGGNQHNLNLKLVSSIPLIVPPKELQLKFVSIAKQADKSGFDGLKSQFIEMFGNCSERKSLCSICRPKQWPTIPTKDFTEDGYLVYGANGVIGHYTEYNHENPTILMACRGASCGAINISRPKSYITGNAMCLDELSEEVKFEYLAYFLSQFDYKIIITGGAQPQITYTNLKKVDVPIPAIELQCEFVKIFQQADKSGSVLLYRIAC